MFTFFNATPLAARAAWSAQSSESLSHPRDHAIDHRLRRLRRHRDDRNVDRLCLQRALHLRIRADHQAVPALADLVGVRIEHRLDVEALPPEILIAATAPRRSCPRPPAPPASVAPARGSSAAPRSARARHSPARVCRTCQKTKGPCAPAPLSCRNDAPALHWTASVSLRLQLVQQPQVDRQPAYRRIGNLLHAPARVLGQLRRAQSRFEPDPPAGRDCETIHKLNLFSAADAVNHFAGQGSASGFRYTRRDG